MRTKNRNETKIARKKSCFCCPQALAVQQCATPRAPRQFAACSLLAKFEALLMLMQINAKVHSTTVAGCRVALLHSSENAYKTAERNRQPTNVCAPSYPPAMQRCCDSAYAPSECQKCAAKCDLGENCGFWSKCNTHAHTCIHRVYNKC